jgi:hypothetical protein
MDLIGLVIPMDDGTYTHLLNIAMEKNHVEEIDIDSEMEEIPGLVKETPPGFSPDESPFSKEEEFDTIDWPKKGSYQQQLEKYKNKDIVSIKILKKDDKDLLITLESHPPHSRQYTRVIQEQVDNKREYFKQGDLVLEWDRKKGKPNTHKEFEKFSLGPFEIEKSSVNDSYYLYTLQGRMRPL